MKFISHTITEDDEVTLYGPFDTNDEAMAYGKAIFDDPDSEVKGYGSDRLLEPEVQTA